MKAPVKRNRITISAVSNIVKRIAKRRSKKYGYFTQAQVAYIVSMFVNEIFDDVKHGKSVTIRGFGRFSRGEIKRKSYVMPNGQHVQHNDKRYKIVFLPTSTCTNDLNE